MTQRSAKRFRKRSGEISIRRNRNPKSFSVFILMGGKKAWSSNPARISRTQTEFNHPAASPHGGFVLERTSAQIPDL